MKPAPFDYHRPASLVEVFDLLDRYGDDGRILAGGQSLVPALNMRLATPRAVIDINRLPGLDAAPASIPRSIRRPVADRVLIAQFFDDGRESLTQACPTGRRQIAPAALGRKVLHRYRAH